MNLSVIIPTLNEAETIETSVASAIGPAREVIVADGGSGDSTMELAARAGAKVICAPPGRGVQMNHGARQAQGDTLLFLHADTVLPTSFVEEVERVLGLDGVAAGAFQLRIGVEDRRARVIEWLVLCRSRLFSRPYGDQALFARQEVFWQAGGFPDQPILEDVEFVRRARRMGRIGLADASVVTSARRWERLGYLKTTALNQAILFAAVLGVAPARLQGWYRVFKQG